MRFLAMYAKDLSDEFEELTEYSFDALTWSEAVVKAEQQAAKLQMEMDSIALLA